MSASHRERPSSPSVHAHAHAPVRDPDELPHIGWREWVALPDLGVRRVKAKVDTGALTSALHAFDIRRFRRGKKRMVRFKIHPYQRDTKRTVEAEAPLADRRMVRSSSGHETLRAVIVTEVEVLGQRWPIELTLVARGDMGFRMLLGRQALRGRFVVDPGRSFEGGRPKLKSKAGARKKSKRKKKKGTGKSPRTGKGAAGDPQS